MMKMMMTCDRFVVVVLLLQSALMMQGVTALYCAKCTSLEDPLCAIGFVSPTRCSSYQKACMTYVGLMPEPGTDVVIRDCAEHLVGSFCTPVDTSGPGLSSRPEIDSEPEVSDDSFQHEICIRTCRRSNCNNEPHFALYRYRQ